MGSTGRIAEGIGQALQRRGYRAEVAYGRHESAGQVAHWPVGGRVNIAGHGAVSLLADAHGLGSRHATDRLVSRLAADPPGLVVLHNLHGYFLNYPKLFAALKRLVIPVAWVLHDCWAFTGHCAYFDRANCSRWRSGCGACPLTRQYPRAMIDRSGRNWEIKRRAFSDVQSGLIVTPSEWLAAHVSESFLGGWRRQVIPNGVDLNVFHPLEPTERIAPIILGVAAGWPARKGLHDMCALREHLPAHWRIILVGVTTQQQRDLPPGVEGLRRTESMEELARLYSRAAVFVNPTTIDNFPTTNIEALACGTPVVTYDTGGSPESLDPSVGSVVPKGGLGAISEAVRHWGERSERGESADIARRCRAHAERFFDAKTRFDEHVDAYEELLSG
ncbi:glycosyltransferase [Spiribacter sp. 221]|uniref:glycosyltransferase n=1 Tax=Spiribacter onubensis TaxID=3122420 RepID=UPI00349F140C